MKKLNILKKIFKKGGEVKMKRLLLVTTVALLMVMPTLAWAQISIGVGGQITAGKELKGPTIFKCNGAIPLTPTNFDVVCPLAPSQSAIDFGVLSHTITVGGTTYDAGCFYGQYYFVVFLYPNAWGGAGYQVSQTTTGTSTAVGNALIVKPNYAADDQFLLPDGSRVAQGSMTSTEISDNPQVASTAAPSFAKNSALIFKARRGRIIEAIYAIPPFPANTSDLRPSGWVAIPTSTPAVTFSGITITFSLADY